VFKVNIFYLKNHKKKNSLFLNRTKNTLTLCFSFYLGGGGREGRDDRKVIHFN